MEEKEDKIEQYLNGELSDTERSSFEKEMSEDPELAKTVQLEEDLMEGIEAAGNDDLKSQLQQIHQEEVVPQAPKVKRLKVKRYRWIAAAAIIGIVALTWWQMSQSFVSSEELYEQYAEYTFQFTEKGTNEEVLTEAENLLEQGDFQNAVPLLEQSLAQNPNAPDVKLALGIALLETRQNDKEAVRLLEEVGQEGGFYLDESYWHQGLAYLKMGQAEKSLEVLKKVSPASARFVSARELIRDLMEKGLI